MDFDTVIGLEVHIQLCTNSKLFSRATVGFGAPANTNASMIDVAMPGTLPQVNQQAIDMAIKFGLAIGCGINRHSIFERKHYFYPDLPKGYQTTQLLEPIILSGTLEIGDGKSVRIHHAHLEEDAGKSIHDASAHRSLIDLNRAGTPLIELVTEPDMASAEEAVFFLKKIHRVATYLGICDGNMSQGSLRCDANISIKPKGDKELGTRTELKNINSFRFVKNAIEGEVQRQIDVVKGGGKITQQTRLYDETLDVTRLMRSKEDSNDYRYMPCPDLMPIVLQEQEIEAIAKNVPELPWIRQEKFVQQYGLTVQQAESLTSSKALADLFDYPKDAIKRQSLSMEKWGKLLLNSNLDNILDDIHATAEELALMMSYIQQKTISSNPKLLPNFLLYKRDHPKKSLDDFIEQEDLKQDTDNETTQLLVNTILSEYSEQLASYRAAEDNKRVRMLGFFVGQIMKLSQGKIEPSQASKMMKEALEDEKR